jgi:hypothetical protein
MEIVVGAYEASDADAATATNPFAPPRFGGRRR